MIENQPRELTLIYHSEKSDDKKARGYVESLRLSVKTLDLAKEALTETQLAQIADKMELPVESLIDTTYYDGSSIEEKASLKKMDTTQLLTFVKRNPKILHTPILIIGDRAYKYGTGYHLIKDNMAEGVKSVSDVVNAEERKN